MINDRQNPRRADSTPRTEKLAQNPCQTEPILEKERALSLTSRNVRKPFPRTTPVP